MNFQYKEGCFVSWPGRSYCNIYYGVNSQVLRNKPDFRRKPWPSMSDSAKDFVKKLLVKDPRARLTAAQALCMYMHSDPFRSVGYAVHLRHVLWTVNFT